MWSAPLRGSSTARVEDDREERGDHEQATIRASRTNSTEPTPVASTRPIDARIVRTGHAAATAPASRASDTDGLTSLPAMGQPITVIEKPTSRPGVVRFELNRSLTGMGHERYRSRDDATGDRPADELARRLFDRGGVDGVHIYSNVDHRRPGRGRVGRRA